MSSPSLAGGESLSNAPTHSFARSHARIARTKTKADFPVAGAAPLPLTSDIDVVCIFSVFRSEPKACGPLYRLMLLLLVSPFFVRPASWSCSWVSHWLSVRLFALSGKPIRSHPALLPWWRLPWTLFHWAPLSCWESSLVPAFPIWASPVMSSHSMCFNQTVQRDRHNQHFSN